MKKALFLSLFMLLLPTLNARNEQVNDLPGVVLLEAIPLEQLACNVFTFLDAQDSYNLNATLVYTWQHYGFPGVRALLRSTKEDFVPLCYAQTIASAVDLDNTNAVFASNMSVGVLLTHVARY